MVKSRTSKLIAAFLLAWVSLNSASAVTFDITLDAVRDSGGNLVSVDTLALLVVDTDNDGIFNAPLPDASTDQDVPFGTDFTAWKGDFSGGGDGAFFASAIFDIGTVNIPDNRAFALYWFPTLTLVESVIPGGTEYGSYTTTDALQFGSGSAWNVGTNNSGSYTINAFTVNNTGNFTTDPEPSGLPNSALQAQGVPEPTTSLLLLGAVALAAFRRRHSQMC